MKKLFDFIRLPLEGKLSPRVTDEVENTPNEKHLIRQVNPTPSPRGEGSRRGFTLVELVIALTLIVLVTGVSIGVVMVNTNTHAETIDMIEATNIAENAVECFRFAVNNGEGESGKRSLFDNCLAKSLNPDFEPEEVDGLVTNYPFTAEDNTYTVNDGRVTVTLVVDFTAKTITITATNNGTNEYLIETVTYRVR